MSMRFRLVAACLIFGSLVFGSRPAHADTPIVRDGDDFSIDFSGLDVCFARPEALRDEARCGPMAYDVLERLDQRARTDAVTWLAVGVIRREAPPTLMMLNLVKKRESTQRPNEEDAKRSADSTANGVLSGLKKSGVAIDIPIKKSHEVARVGDFWVTRAKVDLGELPPDIPQRGLVEHSTMTSFYADGTVYALGVTTSSENAAAADTLIAELEKRARIAKPVAEQREDEAPGYKLGYYLGIAATTLLPIALIARELWRRRKRAAESAAELARAEESKPKRKRKRKARAPEHAAPPSEA